MIDEPLARAASRTRPTVSAGLARAFFDPEIRSWRGEQPLWMVFWVYGVITTSGLGVIYAAGLYADRFGLQEVLLLCIAGYTFWLLISLWRSSQLAIDTLWGALACQLTVVWAVAAVLVLTFLQFDLVVKYLDPAFTTAFIGSPTDAGVQDDQDSRESP